MKRLVRLLVLGLPVILSGCYAASVMELDGLKPADVTVPADVNKLTVVSRCDLDSTYKALSRSSNRLPQFTMDSTMSKQVVLGCSDALSESPRFSLFNPVVRRIFSGSESDSQEKIPWDIIRMVAGDPPCDAVLSFENGNVQDTLTYLFLDGWSMPHYVVIVKTHWRLYRLSDFQSKDFNYADTVSFSIASFADFSSSPELGIDCLKDAMYESGVETARRLAPWWTSFQRYYFGMTPVGLARGGEFLKNGDWQQAAESFRPLTETSGNRTKAKACFNMALTCEMANNIPAALDWLKQSEKLGMHEYYIGNYRTKLIRRKVETGQLNEQMR